MDNMSIAPVFQDNHPPENDFASAVLNGLRATSKKLSPKFFYDEVGAKLFNAICSTEEYYLTRTESAILRDNLDDIARQLGKGCTLIEPGSGNSAKVREMLHAIKPLSYIPMDISKVMLKSEAQKLATEFPWLNVHSVCSDFTTSMQLPQLSKGTKPVAFFPGSSIGNFDPDEASRFLADVREMVSPKGGLLIGVDLKKEESILNAAYNDQTGITECFNRNILTRINKELGANFDIRQFRHDAFYNADLGRIEMHLVSLRDQIITIGDQAIEFECGETIHTENSYKYTVQEFQKLATDAGFNAATVWTDPNKLFSVQYFTATP